MIVRLATRAMGTRFELVLAGEDERYVRAVGEAAVAEIEEQDRRLSLFRRDSLTARINRSAHHSPVKLDADTYALFAEALAVGAASDGAFDIAVARRMRERGFHVDSMLGPEAVGGAPPGRIALEATTRSLRFTAPGIAVDLGGIAKGHALDLAAKTLREAGIEAALLHGGTSTAIALGAPPGTDGWRIAIQGEGAPVVVLRDTALSVSAAHGRTRADGAGHVLDPRTGESAPADRVAAVLAPRARLADAWSTALVADGSARGLDPSASAALFHHGDWSLFGTAADRFVLPPRREPSLLSVST